MSALTLQTDEFNVEQARRGSSSYTYKFTFLTPRSYARPDSGVDYNDSNVDEFVRHFLGRAERDFHMACDLVNEPSEAYIDGFDAFEERFLRHSEYSVILVSPKSSRCLQLFYPRLFVFLQSRPEWSNRFLLVYLGPVVMKKPFDLEVFALDPIQFPAESWRNADEAWHQMFHLLKMEWIPYDGTSRRTSVIPEPFIQSNVPIHEVITTEIKQEDVISIQADNKEEETTSTTEPIQSGTFKLEVSNETLVVCISKEKQEESLEVSKCPSLETSTKISDENSTINVGAEISLTDLNHVIDDLSTNATPNELDEVTLYYDIVHASGHKCRSKNTGCVAEMLNYKNHFINNTISEACSWTEVVPSRQLQLDVSVESEGNDHLPLLDFEIVSPRFRVSKTEDFGFELVDIDCNENTDMEKIDDAREDITTEATEWTQSMYIEDTCDVVPHFTVSLNTDDAVDVTEESDKLLEHIQCEGQQKDGETSVSNTVHVSKIEETFSGLETTKTVVEDVRWYSHSITQSVLIKDDTIKHEDFDMSDLILTKLPLEEDSLTHWMAPKVIDQSKDMETVDLIEQYNQDVKKAYADNALSSFEFIQDTIINTESQSLQTLLTDEHVKEEENEKPEEEKNVAVPLEQVIEVEINVEDLKKSHEPVLYFVEPENEVSEANEVLLDQDVNELELNVDLETDIQVQAHVGRSTKSGRKKIDVTEVAKQITTSVLNEAVHMLEKSEKETDVSSENILESQGTDEVVLSIEKQPITMTTYTESNITEKAQDIIEHVSPAEENATNMENISPVETDVTETNQLLQETVTDPTTIEETVEIKDLVEEQGTEEQPSAETTSNTSINVSETDGHVSITSVTETTFETSNIVRVTQTSDFNKSLTEEVKTVDVEENSEEKPHVEDVTNEIQQTSAESSIEAFELHENIEVITETVEELKEESKSIELEKEVVSDQTTTIVSIEVERISETAHLDEYNVEEAIKEISTVPEESSITIKTTNIELENEVVSVTDSISINITPGESLVQIKSIITEESEKISVIEKHTTEHEETHIQIELKEPEQEVLSEIQSVEDKVEDTIDEDSKVVEEAKEDIQLPDATVAVETSTTVTEADGQLDITTFKGTTVETTTFVTKKIERTLVITANTQEDVEVTPEKEVPHENDTIVIVKTSDVKESLTEEEKIVSEVLDVVDVTNKMTVTSEEQIPVAIDTQADSQVELQDQPAITVLENNVITELEEQSKVITTDLEHSSHEVATLDHLETQESLNETVKLLEEVVTVQTETIVSLQAESISQRVHSDGLKVEENAKDDSIVKEESTIIIQTTDNEPKSDIQVEVQESVNVTDTISTTISESENILQITNLTESTVETSTIITEESRKISVIEINTTEHEETHIQTELKEPEQDVIQEIHSEEVKVQEAIDDQETIIVTQVTDVVETSKDVVQLPEVTETDEMSTTVTEVDGQVEITSVTENTVETSTVVTTEIKRTLVIEITANSQGNFEEMIEKDVINVDTSEVKESHSEKEVIETPLHDGKTGEFDVVDVIPEIHSEEVKVENIINQETSAVIHATDGVEELKVDLSLPEGTVTDETSIKVTEVDGHADIATVKETTVETTSFVTTKIERTLVINANTQEYIEEMPEKEVPCENDTTAFVETSDVKEEEKVVSEEVIENPLYEVRSEELNVVDVTNELKDTLTEQIPAVIDIQEDSQVEFQEQTAITVLDKTVITESSEQSTVITTDTEHSSHEVASLEHVDTQESSNESLKLEEEVVTVQSETIVSLQVESISEIIDSDEHKVKENEKDDSTVKEDSTIITQSTEAEHESELQAEVVESARVTDTVSTTTESENIVQITNQTESTAETSTIITEESRKMSIIEIKTTKHEETHIQTELKEPEQVVIQENYSEEVKVQEAIDEDSQVNQGAIIVQQDTDVVEKSKVEVQLPENTLTDETSTTVTEVDGREEITSVTENTIQTSTVVTKEIKGTLVIEFTENFQRNLEETIEKEVINVDTSQMKEGLSDKEAETPLHDRKTDEFDVVDVTNELKNTLEEQIPVVIDIQTDLQVEFEEKTAITVLDKIVITESSEQSTVITADLEHGNNEVASFEHVETRESSNESIKLEEEVVTLQTETIVSLQVESIPEAVYSDVKLQLEVQEPISVTDTTSTTTAESENIVQITNLTEITVETSTVITEESEKVSVIEISTTEREETHVNTELNEPEQEVIQEIHSGEVKVTDTINEDSKVEQERSIVTQVMDVVKENKDVVQLPEVTVTDETSTTVTEVGGQVDTTTVMETTVKTSTFVTTKIERTLVINANTQEDVEETLEKEVPIENDTIAVVETADVKASLIEKEKVVSEEVIEKPLHEMKTEEFNVVDVTNELKGTFEEQFPVVIYTQTDSNVELQEEKSGITILEKTVITESSEQSTVITTDTEHGSHEVASLELVQTQESSNESIKLEEEVVTIQSKTIVSLQVGSISETIDSDEHKVEENAKDDYTVKEDSTLITQTTEVEHESELQVDVPVTVNATDTVSTTTTTESENIVQITNLTESTVETTTVITEVSEKVSIIEANTTEHEETHVNTELKEPEQEVIQEIHSEKVKVTDTINEDSQVNQETIIVQEATDVVEEYKDVVQLPEVTVTDETSATVTEVDGQVEIIPVTENTVGTSTSITTEIERTLVIEITEKTQEDAKENPEKEVLTENDTITVVETSQVKGSLTEEVNVVSEDVIEKTEVLDVVDVTNELKDALKEEIPVVIDIQTHSHVELQEKTEITILEKTVITESCELSIVISGDLEHSIYDVAALEHVETQESSNKTIKIVENLEVVTETANDITFEKGETEVLEETKVESESLELEDEIPKTNESSAVESVSEEVHLDELKVEESTTEVEHESELQVEVPVNVNGTDTFSTTTTESENIVQITNLTESTIETSTVITEVLKKISVIEITTTEHDKTHVETELKVPEQEVIPEIHSEEVKVTDTIDEGSKIKQESTVHIHVSDVVEESKVDAQLPENTLTNETSTTVTEVEGRVEIPSVTENTVETTTFITTTIERSLMIDINAHTQEDAEETSEVKESLTEEDNAESEEMKPIEVEEKVQTTELEIETVTDLPMTTEILEVEKSSTAEAQISESILNALEEDTKHFEITEIHSTSVTTRTIEIQETKLHEEEIGQADPIVLEGIEIHESTESTNVILVMEDKLKSDVQLLEVEDKLEDQTEMPIITENTLTLSEDGVDVKLPEIVQTENTFQDSDIHVEVVKCTLFDFEKISSEEIHRTLEHTLVETVEVSESSVETTTIHQELTEFIQSSEVETSSLEGKTEVDAHKKLEDSNETTPSDSNEQNMEKYNITETAFEIETVKSSKLEETLEVIGSEEFVTSSIVEKEIQIQEETVSEAVDSQKEQSEEKASNENENSMETSENILGNSSEEITKTSIIEVTISSHTEVHCVTSANVEMLKSDVENLVIHEELPSAVEACDEPESQTEVIKEKIEEISVEATSETVLEQISHGVLTYEDEETQKEEQIISLSVNTDDTVDGSIVCKTKEIQEELLELKATEETTSIFEQVAVEIQKLETRKECGVTFERESEKSVDQESSCLISTENEQETNSLLALEVIAVTNTDETEDVNSQLDESISHISESTVETVEHHILTETQEIPCSTVGLSSSVEAHLPLSELINQVIATQDIDQTSLLEYTDQTSSTAKELIIITTVVSENSITDDAAIPYAETISGELSTELHDESLLNEETNEFSKLEGHSLTIEKNTEIETISHQIEINIVRSEEIEVIAAAGEITKTTSINDTETTFQKITISSDETYSETKDITQELETEMILHEENTDGVKSFIQEDSVDSVCAIHLSSTEIITQETVHFDESKDESTTCEENAENPENNDSLIFQRVESVVKAVKGKSTKAAVTKGDKPSPNLQTKRLSITYTANPCLILTPSTYSASTPSKQTGRKRNKKPEEVAKSFLRDLEKNMGTEMFREKCTVPEVKGEALFEDLQEFQDHFLKNESALIILVEKEQAHSFETFFARIFVFLSFYPDWSSKILIVFLNKLQIAAKYNLDVLPNAPIQYNTSSSEGIKTIMDFVRENK